MPARLLPGMPPAAVSFGRALVSVARFTADILVHDAGAAPRRVDERAGPRPAGR